MLDILESGAYELFQIICVITLSFYFLIRTSAFNRIIRNEGQRNDYLIMILFFGILSVYGTMSGLFGFGALINVRDLGPLIGGLTCGPVIGIGSAIIGVAYRYTLGGETMIPCILGTLFAGSFSGLVWYINKRNYIGTWQAVLCMLFVELVHFGLVIVLTEDKSELPGIIANLGPPVIGTNMVATAIYGIIFTNYREEQRTKEEIKRRDAELSVAREIQETFLPGKSAIIPGYDIHAIARPAKEVGGDFYDIIPLQGGKYSFVIADVSGKSIPAAIFMALSITSVRAYCESDRQPSAVIAHANNLIFKYAESGMFVSLWYGMLSPESDRLSFVNAGHPPPILLRSSGLVEELKRTGPVAGFVKGELYPQGEVQLEPGDSIVSYTDGVIEARNSKGEMFGRNRLISVIQEHAAMTAEEIIMSINRELDQFAEGEHQFDDITLLVVKKEPSGDKHQPIQ